MWIGSGYRKWKLIYNGSFPMTIVHLYGREAFAGIAVILIFVIAERRMNNEKDILFV